MHPLGPDGADAFKHDGGETIFSLPGLGSLAVSAVLDPDLAILVGVTLLTAVFIIVANLVVDVLYAVIDPRVRLV